MTLLERAGVKMLYDHVSGVRVSNRDDKRALDAALVWLARQVKLDDKRRETPRGPYKRTSCK